jgi:hypothetical protein
MDQSALLKQTNGCFHRESYCIMDCKKSKNCVIIINTIECYQERIKMNRGFGSIQFTQSSASRVNLKTFYLILPKIFAVEFLFTTNVSLIKKKRGWCC